MGVETVRSVADSREATLLVTTAGPPNGGLVARQTGSDRLERLTSRDGQDDPGASDLEPRQRLATGYLLKGRKIGGRDGERMWSSTAHTSSSHPSNSLHDFVPPRATAITRGTTMRSLEPIARIHRPALDLVEQ